MSRNTTAYDLAANRMVERIHHQLNSAITKVKNGSISLLLCSVLLGIHSAWREEDLQTALELVYGEPLRLPGEFLFQSNGTSNTQLTRYANQLFIFKDLATTNHLFVRNDSIKTTAPAICWSKWVFEPGDKPFTINIKLIDLNRHML